MADQPVPREQAAVASQNNLLSFLATGAGPAIAERHVRAAMFLRANVLLRAVRVSDWRSLNDWFAFCKPTRYPSSANLVRSAPAETLSRCQPSPGPLPVKPNSPRVRLGDQIVDGHTALKKLGLEPLELLPKEGLAIVNGTSFSSAIAANAVFETTNLMATGNRCPGDDAASVVGSGKSV